MVLPSWPCCIPIIHVFGPIFINLWSTAEDWRAITLISFLLSKCPVRFKAACAHAKPWSNYHFVSVQKTEKVTSSWWWKRITAACQHRLKTQANGLESDATSRMWRRRFVLRQTSCLFCQECEKISDRNEPMIFQKTGGCPYRGRSLNSIRLGLFTRHTLRSKTRTTFS